MFDLLREGNFVQNIVRKLVYICNNAETSNTYRQIADILIPNLFQAANMNIQDLADLCSCSTATFSRFCRSIGYKNFHDFSTSLNDTLSEYRYKGGSSPVSGQVNILENFLEIFSDRVSQLKTSLNAEVMDAVTQDIYQSSRICFFSTFEGSISAFQQDLIITGKPANLYIASSQQLEAAKSLDKDSMILLVDCKINSATTLEAFKLGKTQGAKTAAIISSLTPSKTIYHYADHILSFEGTNSEMDLHLFDIYVHLLKLDYCTKYLDAINA